MFDERQRQASDQAACVWCQLLAVMWMTWLLWESFVNSEKQQRRCGGEWLNAVEHVSLFLHYGFYTALLFKDTPAGWMLAVTEVGTLPLNMPPPCCTFLESWLFGDDWNSMQCFERMAMRKAAFLHSRGQRCFLYSPSLWRVRVKGGLFYMR